MDLVQCVCFTSPFSFSHTLRVAALFLFRSLLPIDMDVFVLLVAYRIEVPFLQALLVYSAQQVLQSQWPVSVIQQLSHGFPHQQTEK